MRTLLLIISLLASCTMFGQNVPKITVSTEKVNVNGAIMLVHKVKGGETLYSIAKAYNVTIDEIVRQNEFLKAGLKEGSTIYIPSSKTADSVAQQSTTENTSAAKLELQKDDLKKYSRKKKHTVKWYETIDDVAAKYNVPVDAIVALNGLQTTMLQKKQQLYIPNDEFVVYLESHNKPEQPQEDSLDKMEFGQQTISVTVEQPAFKPSTELSLAYVLPLDLNDTVKVNSNFMDFYAGSLLAANNLKEKGFKLSITLVDQSSCASMESVAQSTLYNNDIIVGPVKSADMAKILPFIGKETLVVSPMDPSGEKLIASNSNVMHAPAVSAAQINNLIDFMGSKHAADTNVVVIYEKEGTDGALVNVSKALLNGKGIAYRELSYGILEGREILESIMKFMEPGKNNFVFVASNNEAFVNDAVRNLNLLCTNPLEENRRTITLFGTPRWRNFETIEIELFHRMNLHLSLPYFVDYSNADVQDFLMKYRALYNAEPTPFAFQGYDITTYTIEQIGKYGRGAHNAKKLDYSKMLQSNYNFNRENQEDGLINGATVNVIYNNDFTVSTVE